MWNFVFLSDIPPALSGSLKPLQRNVSSAFVIASSIFPFSTSFSVEGKLIKTELNGGFEMLSSRFLSALFPNTELLKTAVGIFLQYGRQVWGRLTDWNKCCTWGVSSVLWGALGDLSNVKIECVRGWRLSGLE